MKDKTDYRAEMAQTLRSRMTQEYAKIRSLVKDNPDQTEFFWSLPDDLIGDVEVKYMQNGLKDLQVELEGTATDYMGQMAPASFRITRKGTPRRPVQISALDEDGNIYPMFVSAEEADRLFALID